MTTKKAAAEEPPTEFNWLALSQPTPEPDESWKAVKQPSTPGPWWVKDSNGAQYATHVLVEGQTPLDESPLNRSGELRTPIPGGIDTAPAD